MNDWKAQLRDVRAELPEGVGHEVQNITLSREPVRMGGLPLLDAGGMIHLTNGLVFNRQLWNRQQEARRILAMIPHNILVIGWKTMHDAELSIQERLELFKFRRKWEKEHGDMLMPWKRR